MKGLWAAMNRDVDLHNKRGAAILEFALTATVFFMMLVVIVSGGNLFFTYNALVESTRRGARYAATQCDPSDTNCADQANSLTHVRNVVVYGNPCGGTTPLAYNLQPSNVTVTYSTNTAATGELPNGFGVGRGTVSVKIENYDYTFWTIGGFVIHMPQFQTTAAGESAGYDVCGGSLPAQCP